MLENIPGVIRTNKLRIIQILEADLNQVLLSAFSRNVRKLAQDEDGVNTSGKAGAQIPHLPLGDD
jgi:hypothetical protein